MDKFTSKHFIFIILAVSIVAMKTYPRTFMIHGQRESWIAVIVSSIIIFFFYIYMISIWKKSDGKSILEIYQNTLGNKTGNFFMILFLSNLFFILIECSSVQADSMHQNMLIETPQWFFLLFFIIPSIYVIKKNLVAVVTITMIGIIFIMIAGINLGLLTIKYKHASMLFPIFQDGIKFDFFLSVLETLGLYGSVSISFIYLTYINDNKKNMIKYVIIALIVLIQMEIVSITGVLMTFTPFRAISMNYPKLLQTQLVSYFQFLDFGELYVMLQISGGWLLKYLITFYGILTILKNYNFSKQKLNILTYIISGMVLVGSYFISGNSFILFKVLYYFQYICLVNFIIIPFIIFTIYSIKLRFNKINIKSS
ncbi:MAG: endospore germination permease [Eubacteriaceae bacterium]